MSDDANLTNANLTGADLTFARLTNANLTNANLTNADLTDADLRDADMLNTQLNYNSITSTPPFELQLVDTLDGSNITGTLVELQEIAGDYSDVLHSGITLTISDIEQRSNSDIAGLQASTTATVVDSLNPVLISASTSTDGTTVTLVFDESLSGDNTSVDHFEISGDRVIEIASLSIDGDTVTLNISDDTPIREGDNQTVSLAVESISDTSGNAASLSAVDITNNSTVSATNTIPSIVGRGRLKGRSRLKGTGAADLFAFHEFDSFKRRNADLIINFNPLQGDKISVSADALPSLEGADEISFASARTGRERRKFSRQEIDLVYCEQTGRLLANGNGKGRRWGNRNEGGHGDSSRSTLANCR